jgi:hypothetical protein
MYNNFFYILFSLKDILESLEDCIASIDESFGANLKYYLLFNIFNRLSIGESFIDVNEDEAKEYVAKQQKKYEETRKGLIDKYEKNKKRVDELKIILYAKFGKGIHLEED